MPLLPVRHYVERFPCGCELSHVDGVVQGTLCCREHAGFNAVMTALGQLEHDLKEAHGDSSPTRVLEERMLQSMHRFSAAAWDTYRAPCGCGYTSRAGILRELELCREHGSCQDVRIGGMKLWAEVRQAHAELSPEKVVEGRT